MRIYKTRRKQPALDRPSWTYQYQDYFRSQEADFSFRASVRFTWSVEDLSIRPEPSYVSAATRIRKVAEGIARSSSVLRAPATEQDINIALSQLVSSSSDGVSICAARMALHVDAETLENARRLERERQEGAIERLHRDRLRDRMNFIRMEALSDPAAARIFWLVEHQGNGDYATSTALLDDLVRQSSLWTPSSRWVVVAQLLYKFVERMPEIRRDRLVDQLAKIFVEYGEAGLAEELSQYKNDRTTGDIV